MLINAKINLKRYFFYSLGLLASSLFFIRNLKEFLVILGVFAAACANHWMLIYIVRSMSADVVSKIPRNNFFLLLLFIGKLLLVVLAISLGVQIMGKRIIIPILIYVLQIAILYKGFQ